MGPSLCGLAKVVRKFAAMDSIPLETPTQFRWRR